MRGAMIAGVALVALSACRDDGSRRVYDGNAINDQDRIIAAELTANQSTTEQGPRVQRCRSVAQIEGPLDLVYTVNPETGYRNGTTILPGPYVDENQKFVFDRCMNDTGK